MKKIISLTLTIIMLAVLTTTVFAQDFEDITWDSEYASIDWNAEYSDDRILVTLHPGSYSEEEPLTVEDFPEVEIDEVRVLMDLPDMYTVVLHLSNLGKDQVKIAIDALETNPMVWFAGPNYFMYPAGDIEPIPITDTHPLGDVNLDLDVGLKDAVIIIQHVAGYDIAWSNEINTLADVNEDGDVNLKDAVIVIRKCADLE